ncbi:hypothetical protein [Blautia glucerasea]|nr:hypothetical protein [Blautia glucerasea]
MTKAQSAQVVPLNEARWSFQVIRKVENDSKDSKRGYSMYVVLKVQ